MFGADNIVGVSFGTNNQPDQQSVWCHIQCLNAMVYTEWILKSTYILRRHIDFIPHSGASTVRTQTRRQYGSRKPP